MEWKIIVSFIMIGTHQHGYAVPDERYSSFELCDVAISGVESRAVLDLENLSQGKVQVLSECIEDKPASDGRGA